MSGANDDYIKLLKVHFSLVALCVLGELQHLAIIITDNVAGVLFASCIDTIWSNDRVVRRGRRRKFIRNQLTSINFVIHCKTPTFDNAGVYEYSTAEMPVDRPACRDSRYHGRHAAKSGHQMPHQERCAP